MSAITQFDLLMHKFVNIVSAEKPAATLVQPDELKLILSFVSGQMLQAYGISQPQTPAVSG